MTQKSHSKEETKTLMVGWIYGFAAGFVVAYALRFWL